jgi:hypothetical protein
MVSPAAANEFSMRLILLLLLLQLVDPYMQQTEEMTNVSGDHVAKERERERQWSEWRLELLIYDIQQQLSAHVQQQLLDLKYIYTVNRGSQYSNMKHN